MIAKTEVKSPRGEREREELQYPRSPSAQVLGSAPSLISTMDQESFYYSKGMRWFLYRVNKHRFPGVVQGCGPQFWFWDRCPSDIDPCL